MRWKFALTLITRSHVLISTHHVSPWSCLHRSRLITHVTHSHCHHTYCCNQNKKLALINNLPCIMVSRCDFPVPMTHVWTRGYAKGKDRGRDKTDKGKKKVEINDEQLAEVIKVDTMKTQMQKAVDRMKEDYVKNLSLRSTTGSIETLPVSLDGKEYELQELAQIIRKNPKTIVINMASFPQAIPSAIQALNKSGMNLNPQQDGTTLFVPIPKVTKEHRENLAKNAKALFVKCRDSIRDVQNKYVKTVKNNSTISQDLSHNIQDQITALGDQYIAEGEQIFEAKQSELTGKD